MIIYFPVYVYQSQSVEQFYKPKVSQTREASATFIYMNDIFRVYVKYVFECVKQNIFLYVFIIRAKAH